MKYSLLTADAKLLLLSNHEISACLLHEVIIHCSGIKSNDIKTLCMKDLLYVLIKMFQLDH